MLTWCTFLFSERQKQMEKLKEQEKQKINKFRQQVSSMSTDNSADLPSVPIKRKIFCFLAVFLNLPLSRFILKLFRFF